jgi:hypothetical protein
VVLRRATRRQIPEDGIILILIPKVLVLDASAPPPPVLLVAVIIPLCGRLCGLVVRIFGC